MSDKDVLQPCQELRRRRYEVQAHGFVCRRSELLAALTKVNMKKTGSFLTVTILFCQPLLTVSSYFNPIHDISLILNHFVPKHTVYQTNINLAVNKTLR